MNETENENPYRSTGNEDPLRREKPEDALATTAGERVLMIVIAIVVAIPVFFTTCIGGALAIYSLNSPLRTLRFGEDALVVLIVFCFLTAVFIGCRSSLWFKKRRLSKRAGQGDIE